MRIARLLKSKVAKALAIIALLVAGLWTYLSVTWESRMLKLVLNVEEIPSSVRVLHLHEDFMGGYAIIGRFEIRPEDLPLILKGRNYTSNTWPAELTVRRNGRVMNRWYNASHPGVHLRLNVDEKKELVEFGYGAN